MAEPLRRPSPGASCHWLSHGVRVLDWSKHSPSFVIRDWQAYVKKPELPSDRFVLAGSDHSFEEYLKNLALRLEEASSQLDRAMGELGAIRGRLSQQQAEIDEIKRAVRSVG